MRFENNTFPDAVRSVCPTMPLHAPAAPSSAPRWAPVPAPVGATSKPILVRLSTQKKNFDWKKSQKNLLWLIKNSPNKTKRFKFDIKIIS